ncbi:hypothetical protein E2P81_ATG10812 [Venturia nashicola]|nr:hypothetical protein E2P81_ATG10812 [Venturia nashicola]
MKHWQTSTIPPPMRKLSKATKHFAPNQSEVLGEPSDLAHDWTRAPIHGNRRVFVAMGQCMQRHPSVPERCLMRNGSTYNGGSNDRLVRASVGFCVWQKLRWKGSKCEIKEYPVERSHLPHR